MNDERLGRAIGEFYQETDVIPPNSNESARQITSRLPRTPQVRRRRWLSAARRAPTRRPDANQATDHQPTPITNDQSPTITGRTQSMFSPVKAITAGALIFAIGGAFLIAQPFGQQGSVPGAETEDVAGAWVTGNVEYAASCKTPSITVGEAVRRDWGYACSPQRWTSSDPRLTGIASYRWNEDVYRTDEGTISVNTAAAYVRNDDGGWACSSSNLLKGSGLYPEQLTDETLSCVGEDGYEGLSALLVIDQADPTHPLVGLVFPGDAPPVPEPPAAE